MNLLPYEDSFRRFEILEVQPVNDRTGNRTSEKLSIIKIPECTLVKGRRIPDSGTPFLNSNQTGSREDISENEISDLLAGILLFVGFVLVLILAVIFCYFNRKENEKHEDIPIEPLNVRLYSGIYYRECNSFKILAVPEHCDLCTLFFHFFRMAIRPT